MYVCSNNCNSSSEVLMFLSYVCTRGLNEVIYVFYHFSHVISNFQAKFKLTLEVQSDLVALSNMPVLGETVDGSIKIVHFEESPLMSTYLVAMVVGIFEFVEGVTSQGIKSTFVIAFTSSFEMSLDSLFCTTFHHSNYLGTKVRVYTEVGKSKQGQFALDIGVKSLDLYDE